MPSVDETIRKIDNAICRHLDNLDGSTRGAISQDILEQLSKFINHIMFKFYSNGRDIPFNEENFAEALEYSQVTSRLYTLYKFHNFLEVVTTQYTLDEDGSERLMLKYYKGTSKNPLKIRSKCSAGIEIATFATTLSKHR